MACHSLNPYLVAHMASLSPGGFSLAIFAKWGPEQGQQQTVTIWKPVRHALYHQKQKCVLVEMESRPPARRRNTNQQEPV